jgi:hypothetical protein
MAIYLMKFFRHTLSYFVEMRSLILVGCCWLAGCGSGGPFEYEKVSGRITYEDGSPIPVSGWRLRFVAQDAPQVAGAHPRPAFAIPDAAGNFDSVTSYKFGDGLIPGKHKVSIEMEGVTDARAPAPREYLSTHTTPLTVDTSQAPFDLKLPKPAARGA